MNTYVQVGLGGRHEIFRDAILGKYSENNKLLALCDSNKGRLDLSLKKVEKNFGKTLKGYSAENFENMILEIKPDYLIVTSKDSTHDDYICRAMELACNVITEKPMTIDHKKCQKIIDTQNKTGKECIVTFNYRYSPPRVQVKELLMSGVIGDIISVDFSWLLDTSHGADYFRRWHRNKKNSGGLLVHKSTHHFDLINWWLSVIPKEIFATGSRKFYTPQTADRYNLKNRTERCYTCSEKKKCPFYLDIDDPKTELKELYLNCEEYDGYYRDKCVFSNQIDIEDSMSALITYKNGIRLNYSLNAFMPWEGYIVNFNGTKGRLEHKCEETVYINADGSTPGLLKPEGTSIKIYPHWQNPYQIDLCKAEGGHGGADPVMIESLFGEKESIKQSCGKDQYKRAADFRSGAYSILCGIAANISIKEKKLIKIDDLITNVKLPDYTEMPNSSSTLTTDIKAIKHTNEEEN